MTDLVYSWWRTFRVWSPVIYCIVGNVSRAVPSVNFKCTDRNGVSGRILCQALYVGYKFCHVLSAVYWIWFLSGCCLFTSLKLTKICSKAATIFFFPLAFQQLHVHTQNVCSLWVIDFCAEVLFSSNWGHIRDYGFGAVWGDGCDLLYAVAV